MPTKCRKVLIGFFANCHQCNWRTEDYLKGQKQSAEHSRTHRHLVRAEATYAVDYGTLTGEVRMNNVEKKRYELQQAVTAAQVALADAEDTLRECERELNEFEHEHPDETVET